MRKFLKITGSVSTSAAIALLGMSVNSPRAQSQQFDPLKVEKGLEIAPVPLNYPAANRNLVGYGSYLVNAVGDCNGCHSSNAPPLALYPYVTGHNPYFHQPVKIDPDVYLAGGQSFGAVGTPTGPNGYGGPVIISRNLTPNKSGLPEGGHTLDEFKQILRQGTDFDHIHPNCTPAQIAAINGGATPACIPTGPIVFDAKGNTYNNIPDGSLLQVMPWVTFSNMTDDDIEAIYEYLSAIPCLDNTWSAGPAGDPNELRNDCGT
jgi:hypothetical protein